MGLIPYFYASRDLWVCLSDPSNQDIPAFNSAPEPVLWPAADPNGNQIAVSTTDPALSPSPTDPLTLPDTGKPWLSTPLLIIILVVVLVVATVVLIQIFWKKKNTAPQ